MNVRERERARVAADVVFVTGPGARVAQANLVRWAAEWGEERGVGVRTVFADDEASVIAALAPGALQGTVGVVFCPGDTAAAHA